MKDWADVVVPIANELNTEIGSLLFKVKGGYAFGSATSDGYVKEVDVMRGGGTVDGAFYGVGYTHTHPSTSTFSDGDLDTALEMYREVNGSLSNHGGVAQNAYVAKRDSSIDAWSTNSYFQRYGRGVGYDDLRQDVRKVR